MEAAAVPTLSLAQTQQRRRVLLGLTALRMALGLAMPFCAWYWAEKRYLPVAYIAGQAAAGAVIVWAAWRMWRGQSGRGIMGAAVAVSFFVPFAFDGGEAQIYCAALIGHVGVLAAVVSPEIFIE